MSTTAQPEAEWDATKATRIPPFLRIPTGEVELDGRGELLLDENDEPVVKTQPYLIRRTGKALREILDLETELGIANDQEIEEENDKLDAEEKAAEAAEDGKAPDALKVDIEWLGRRRQERNKKAMRSTFESLALLLVHPGTLEHPDPDVLEENLDFVVAAEWMAILVPRAEQVQIPLEGSENGETRTVTESPTEPASESGGAQSS